MDGERIAGFLEERNPMRLRVSSVLLALFAGCPARAGLIQFNDVITSGQATYNFAYNRFSATVQGPTMESTLTAGQNPLYGVSFGGDTPYSGSGQGGFFAEGLNLGCAAHAGSLNCFMEMGITLLGTPVVTGFINNDEIESQPFTSGLYLSGCDGPGCTNQGEFCYSAGTNCFNAWFLGGGTATITLVPTNTPGDYYESEVAFNFVATPEPSSIVLAALGLAGMALAYRTRRSAQL
jgi:hypothetical protein